MSLYKIDSSFVNDLAYLVNIDSGTGTPDGVRKVADFLADKYKAAGLRVMLKTFDDIYGPCVEARSHPGDENIDLLLIGHMDTVFPKGTAAKRPFTVEHGIGYGPGVADLKAGLVLGTRLVAKLREECPTLRICVANNCDEEIGSPSSQKWLRALAKKSRYCFDFEPGRPNGSFISSRKGVLHLKVIMRGISAHAGVNPDGGASAVLEMSRWVCHFSQEQFSKEGLHVNFGLVNGGIACNVIPDRVESEVDFRYSTKEQLDKVVKCFEQLKENPFDSRITVDIQEIGHIPPMAINGKSQALMNLFLEEGKKLGNEVTFISTGGSSDASFVSAEGVATVDGCGPIGNNLHSDAEYCLIDTAADRLQLLMNVCKRL